jgi:hypothetical protein
LLERWFETRQIKRAMQLGLIAWAQICKQSQQSKRVIMLQRSFNNWRQVSAGQQTAPTDVRTRTHQHTFAAHAHALCWVDSKALFFDAHAWGEAAPQLVAQRDWLEAAQAAIKCAEGPSALEQILTARLAEIHRSEVAASASPAAAPPKPATTAASAEAPAGPAPTPPPPAPTEPGVASGNIATEDGSDGMAARACTDVLTWVDGDKASGQQTTLTVSIRVPAGTKAKNLKVTIKEQALRVEVLTMQGPARVPIDGRLFQQVKAAECVWCVEDGPVAGGERVLIISLEKAQPMRWLLLLRND